MYRYAGIWYGNVGPTVFVKSQWLFLRDRNPIFVFYSYVSDVSDKISLWKLFHLMLYQTAICPKSKTIYSQFAPNPIL